LNYGYGEEWKGSARWIKSLTRMLLGRMVGKKVMAMPDSSQQVKKGRDGDTVE